MQSDDADDANTPSASQQKQHQHQQRSARTAASSFLRAPPSYSSLPSVSDTASAATTRRNSFQPSARPPVEHRYSLFDSRKEPWATLTLRSNVASQHLLPAYFEGQTLNGSLELNLSKPETILGINIEISGTIVATNALSPFTFWKHIHQLWSSEMGDPRIATTQNASGAEASSSTSTDALSFSLSSLSIEKKGKKVASRLSGAYTWPFSITLPSTCSVSLRSKQPPMVLRLPPSFSEKGAAQFINYELNVRIRRGFLRIDSQLGTLFGFVPRVRPSPPTPLRGLAYQDERPLLGPDLDPDGWHVLPSVTITGRVFGVRVVNITCTFALAKPLVYTRGSPIPCLLQITCSDSQALDLLSKPSSTSVHLIREVIYNTDVRTSSNREGSPWSPPLDSSPSDLSLGIPAGTPSVSIPFSILSSKGTSSSDTKQTKSKEKPKNKTKEKEVLQTPRFGPKVPTSGARKGIASAVWWPSNSHESITASSPSIHHNQSWNKRLNGEILLPKDLVPNFSFGGFSISYFLVLLPYHLPGFELRSFSFSPPPSPPSPNTPIPSPTSPTARSPSSLNSHFGSSLSSSSSPTSSSRSGTNIGIDPLLLTQIDIATLHPPGPPMRSYAPPGAHEAKARAESGGNGPVVWGLCA